MEATENRKSFPNKIFLKPFSQRAQRTKPNRSLQSTWIFEVMKNMFFFCAITIQPLTRSCAQTCIIFFSTSYLQYSSVPQIALLALFCCFTLLSLQYISSFSNAEICENITFLLFGFIIIKGLVRGFLPALAEL